MFYMSLEFTQSYGNRKDFISKMVIPGERKMAQ